MAVVQEGGEFEVNMSWAGKVIFLSVIMFVSFNFVSVPST